MFHTSFKYKHYLQALKARTMPNKQKVRRAATDGTLCSHTSLFTPPTQPTQPLSRRRPQRPAPAGPGHPLSSSSASGGHDLRKANSLSRRQHPLAAGLGGGWRTRATSGGRGYPLRRSAAPPAPTP